jgi:hypothetical protein
VGADSVIIFWLVLLTIVIFGRTKKRFQAGGIAPIPYNFGNSFRRVARGNS